MKSVFLDHSAMAARQRIVRSGRTLRLRVEAASLLDDLGYTIRTRFLHPVAYRWRRMEAEISAGAASDAYVSILDTAEILLCYAAQLALALAAEARVTFPAANSLGAKFASGKGGPGFGDWSAILEGIKSRAFREIPADHPLRELRSMLDDTEASEARVRLGARRNDHAHLRRIDEIDLPGAIRAAHADLTTLMENAQFLADWPLIQISSIGWDSLSEIAEVRYRQQMGDHAIVPTLSRDHPANDLEQGSLYLLDSEQNLHLLRPFLLGQICPICRSWSTFHNDLDHGTLVLKSLENGHVVHNASLAEPLRQVGFLRPIS